MKRIYALIAIGLILIVPLISRYRLGIPQDFFSFPMKAHYIQHAPFSLWVSSIFLACYAIYISTVLFLALGAKSKKEASRITDQTAPKEWWYFENPRKIQPGKTYFPYWGYIGIILNLCAWVIAWSKPESLGIISQYTFFPLWLGFALFLDGLVFYRTGSSLFAKNKIQFALIALISSATWWLFEYLGMYVQNWWYEYDETLSTLQHVLGGAASFLTVTPAMLEMAALLTSFPFISDYFSKGSTILGKGPGSVKALIAVALGVISLLLIPVYPNELFFLVWVSPLLICEGMLALAGIPTPVSEMGYGRFGKFFVLNVSALICGFFWEMWNYYSFPKWYYTVPYIQGPQIFEMPIIGYLGYLTFGPLTYSLLLTFWLLIFGKRIS
jgi:hypothetical protein